MAMHINADFSRLAIVDRSKTDWIASPAPGVDRIMLDRIGDEVARATSIVRYAPGSSFVRHEHARGEEFLVLDGVFSDESGAVSYGDDFLCAESWLRFPAAHAASLTMVEKSILWIKRGHLPASG